MGEPVYVRDNLDEVIRGINSRSVFSFDIETTGLNPHDSRILLAQIKIPDGDNFVINVGQVSLAPLSPFFSSNKWTKVIQQVKFDTQFLDYFYKIRTHNVFDTLLADKIVNPSAYSNSLENIAFRYLGRTLNKKTRETFFKLSNTGDFTQEQIRYAAEDSEVLLPIMDLQEEKLAEIGQQHIANLEFSVAPVVGHMELVGIPIDRVLWKKIIKEYATEYEASRLRMNSLIFDSGKLDEQMGMFARDGINLGSQPQVLKAFKAIGINLESTNERVIGLINHPLAKELLVYRGLEKIMDSYGESFLGKIHPFTERLHPDFLQLGTDTGRFSCRAPNVQQIPKKFRSCVGNLEDYVIVGADYSQMELRIIAEMSGDHKLQEAFIAGKDVHKATAALMFNTTLEKVTDEQRFMAKTINFGISYGMGARKLMDTINMESSRKIGFREASGLLNRHRETYSQVSSWLLETGVSAYRNGYSTTMYGRKRFYKRPSREELSEEEYDDKVASIKRQGANSPIQGTNADITKTAMYRLHEELNDLNMRADIISQVHDEIVLVAHKKEAEAVKLLVEESMLNSAQDIITKVPVVVDAYISNVWKK